MAYFNIITPAVQPYGMGIFNCRSNNWGIEQPLECLLFVIICLQNVVMRDNITKASVFTLNGREGYLLATIDTKYELWKNKLLDLGRRNKLINYKDTRMSSLKILRPDCESLYESFVKCEQPIIFPQVKDIADSDESDDPSPEDMAVVVYEEDSSDSALITDKKPLDLQKVLRNLRNKAKTAMEEQGINMLYLSFGPGVEFCVSDIRQSQEWRCRNRAEFG